MTKYPFEVEIEELTSDLDGFVSVVFASLESDFLTMPKGDGFVEYPVFERGYEALKKATDGFEDLAPQKVLEVALAEPIAIIVLRSMLGFTPPEWAYLASQRTGVEVTQGAVRTLDRKVRMDPATPLQLTYLTQQRLSALVTTACDLLSTGPPAVSQNELHRQRKADTEDGLCSLRRLASMGTPYAMLLYERFLGRPFAGHRDSISELVGDRMESAIEEVLTQHRVSYRKTKRAERIEGFDQTPDFIVPSEFNPQVVIEAKITEDDGTARDKVTRIQHLGELSTQGLGGGAPRFEVIACIGGRGFGVRRADMAKMLLATRGKVFTHQTLSQMVEHTRLRKFVTRKP